MLAAIHDIYAEQNSEYTISFQYTDSDDVPLDILQTYSNVRFVVRKSSLPQEKNFFEMAYDDSDVEGYLPYPLSGEYGTVSVISQNQINIIVNTETMSTVYPGSYFYYIFLETLVGEVDCLVKGKFVVEAP